MKKIIYEVVRPDTSKVQTREEAEYQFASIKDTLVVHSYIVDSSPTSKELRQLWFKEIMEQVKTNNSTARNSLIRK